MASLDMSLEDMIKSRKNSERGRGNGRPQRGRGPGGSSYRGGRAYGGSRRGPIGLNTRPSANTIAKTFRRTRALPWQNGLLEDSLKAVGLSGLTNDTKLFVSNLDMGVTSDDIRELFSDIGELKRYAIHYDKDGRPNGSAEVIFVRRSDAFQALKRYNNVQLDGRPMKVEIISSNAEIPLSARVNVVRGSNGKKRTVVMAPGTGPFRGGFTSSNHGFTSSNRGFTSNNRGFTSNSRGPLQRGRGGFNRGRGRGRGRGAANGKKKIVEKSAEELDKELDHYHAESMQS